MNVQQQADRAEPSAAALQPKQQTLHHRRDAEFTETGIFLNQKLFTLRRPQLLRGEFSSGSIRSEAIGKCAQEIRCDVSNVPVAVGVILVCYDTYNFLDWSLYE
jgi:hypothetical protein